MRLWRVSFPKLWCCHQGGTFVLVFNLRAKNMGFFRLWRSRPNPISLFRPPCKKKLTAIAAMWQRAEAVKGPKVAAVEHGAVEEAAIEDAVPP